MSPARALGPSLLRAGFIAAMVLGAVLIGEASLSYLDEGELHPFILEKGQLARPTFFITALYVHVASALVALPTCSILLSRRLLRRAPRLHRWLGRASAALVVAVVVPSGFALAPEARAGRASTLGFVLSGAIVLVMMVQAVARARARDFAGHRRAVAHVVGQMSVAVTSRVMLAALARTSMDPDQAYLVALWLPLGLHFAAVEGLSRGAAGRAASPAARAPAFAWTGALFASTAAPAREERPHPRSPR